MADGRKLKADRIRFSPILLFSVIFLLWAMPFFSVSAQAAVKAEVDRDKIAIDETLTLTISKDSSSFFSKPESAVLEEDFQIVGTNQSSNTQIINGQVSSTVKWVMVLAPRRVGRLLIPALEVGGEKSEPIWIMVEKSAPPVTKTDEKATIFIETEVDHEEVHVQSQLIYTIRVYLSIQAQIQDPQPPDLPDALVEKLEDATFNKTVNGKSYKVFERKYAIFPQKSGVLEIPQASIQGTVPSGRRYGGIFDQFMDQGQTFRMRGNLHSVKVLEKSPEYPASSVWLPTDNLTLGEKWSSDPGQLKVGDSVTLTIDIFGAGLLAAQLPPVLLPEIDGLKLYQNKGETENNISSRGIVGHRTETIALIPTKAGHFALPEIRVPWWDKKHNEIKYAVIPGRELLVTGEAVSEEISRPPVETLTINPDAGGEVVAQEEKPQPMNWIVVSGVMTLLWLMTLALWLRARRKLAAVKIETLGSAQTGKLAQSNNERETFNAFREACLENDPRQVREAVLNWADAYWSERKIRTFGDISKVDSDHELSGELTSLDSFLYGGGKDVTTWDAKVILEIVSKMRNRKMARKEKEGVLPLLYK